MPTFLDLKTRVEGYLLDTPPFTTALVGEWLNKAVNDAEGRHNYKHMEKTLAASTTLATRTLVAVPSDWKEAREAPFFILNDGETVEMAWGISGQAMRRQFAEDDTDDDGEPKFVLEGDTNFSVYPYPDGNSDWPDGEYRVRIPYWGYTAKMVNNSDTNWWTDNWEWYLTFYAAAEGMLANRDTAEATIYFERAEIERQKSMRRSKQQQTKPVHQIVPRRDVYGSGRQPPRR